MPASHPNFPSWNRLALHALWLHGVWETAQCRLFYDMSGVSGASAFGFMIGATGADVVLTLALAAIALRLARGRPRLAALLTLALLGAAAAIGIEITALSLGWWRYSPAMPALLFFGRSIGLLPVVQMAMLPSVALVLARFSFSSKSN